MAVEARVTGGSDGTHLRIAHWGVERQRVPPIGEGPTGAVGLLALLVDRLGLDDREMSVEVFPRVPRQMGLGGSSAFAVSVTRALDRHFGLGLSAEEINALAFDCERGAHGTPSGVDNTLATYGTPMLYRGPGDRGDWAFDALTLPCALPLVIGLTGRRSPTFDTVARVARTR